MNEIVKTRRVLSSLCKVFLVLVFAVFTVAASSEFVSINLASIN